VLRWVATIDESANAGHVSVYARGAHYIKITTTAITKMEDQRGHTLRYEGVHFSFVCLHT
jgi:hypothetical protein